MALVRCILGKFLGVVCHCFPPIFILIEKKVNKTSSALMIFVYQGVTCQCCIQNPKNGVTCVSIISPFVLEKKLGQPISVSFLKQDHCKNRCL